MILLSTLFSLHGREGRTPKSARTWLLVAFDGEFLPSRGLPSSSRKPSYIACLACSAAVVADGKFQCTSTLPPVYSTRSITIHIGTAQRGSFPFAKERSTFPLILSFHKRKRGAFDRARVRRIMLSPTDGQQGEHSA